MYVVAHSRLSQEDEAPRGSRGLYKVPEKRDTPSDSRDATVHRDYRRARSRGPSGFVSALEDALSRFRSGIEFPRGQERTERARSPSGGGRERSEERKFPGHLVEDSRLGGTYFRSRAAATEVAGAYFTWPGLSEGAFNVSALLPTLPVCYSLVEVGPRLRRFVPRVFVSRGLCKPRARARASDTIRRDPSFSQCHGEKETRLSRD